MYNALYEKVVQIRAFEELILDLFGQNKLSGTTHTYIGEEATAVSIMNHIKEQDKIFSNHRCHGHYLAYGGPAKALLAEIMSKKSGLCQGRGGSQHIHYKNFFTNGIQGGIVPNALGVAFSDKLNGKDSNTVVFLGDGTLGQGVVYESLNIAAVYEVPMLFVIEDNQYAMSTRREDVIAGDIKSRIEGFSVKTFEISSTDVDELDSFFDEVFSYIDENRKPVCAVVHNYRLGAHSKGDDTRDKAEIEEHKKADPLKVLEGKIGKDAVDNIYKQTRARYETFVEELDNEDSISVNTDAEENLTDKEELSFLSASTDKYVEIIRDSFRRQLADNSETVIMGEDVRNPYGGAFKATKDLSLDFSSRVLNMPISEACMTGIAVGMAMNKSLPVVEMMFGDFVTLAFDQLLNHAAKYEWVYGDGISVPMILRVPSGAKRGYGPTHSQSLEKYLIGIPLIKVIALNIALDPGLVYNKVFDTINAPTVIIENKKLYGQRKWGIQSNKYNDFEVQEVNNYGFPSICFSMDSESSPDAYILTYGGMVEEACEASYELMMRDEIQADVIAVSQLSPLPIMDIKQLIKEKSPVYVVEEGTERSGIGAEVIASCIQNGMNNKFYRIAAPNIPIPNGLALENQVIPDKDRIVNEIKKG